MTLVLKLFSNNSSAVSNNSSAVSRSSSRVSYNNFLNSNFLNYCRISSLSSIVRRTTREKRCAEYN
ncbi:MAG: hypothetical protein K2G33_04085, partial [Duncaniella sp.]|nr:hypothetical protein [Duncaniella sp.]